ncbi:ion transporter [Convivina intestini]|uniref:Voltage-gated potassium channel n=1 Tax=Convivina intestini TaxID=1505726 RepID=A0A2U1D650_9LACO|nr:ion transporter [Convivina intestini]PVY83161.1 voltage-gated potassium channel [Convivina intestini]CAH1856237.1 hypothetical protein R077811_01216 [Convivina intestini]SDB95716.1 voltage-gated potassium channel [Leuconostocaceae bacterium R-53105]
MKRLYYTIVLALSIISIGLALLDLTNIINIQKEPLAFIDNSILLFFWLDYLLRLSRSKNKWSFFKNNIFDLLAIIPFDSLFAIFRISRTVRLIKLFRIIRIIGFTGKLRTKTKKFINTNGFIYLFLTAVVFILLGAGVYALAENTSYASALWWAIATTTTVGYGDISPHTYTGKIVAVLLMIVGIGLIGSITSVITSYFLGEQHDRETDKIDQRLKIIENDLAEIKALLNDKKQ